MVAPCDLQVFSKVGDVKRIVMGLDKQQLTPCGFCFVVYYTRADTEDCVKYVHFAQCHAVCSSVLQPAVTSAWNAGLDQRYAAALTLQSTMLLQVHQWHDTGRPASPRRL